MRRMVCVVAAFASLAVAMPVSAQVAPSFRADDVIQRFAPPSQDLGAPRSVLGARRGVCVGTEAECAGERSGRGAADASSVQPTFDLMINFALNSDRLTPDARANLDEFARALRDPRLQSFQFSVDGHTDARGTDAHNNELSRRRAEAVARYLAAQGIDSGRLVPRAFGSTQPRTADPMEPVNRRVETRIVQ